MVITRRFLRMGGLAVLGWVLVESFLFYLLGSKIGFLPATLLMMAKGFLGFLLFASHLRMILGKVALSRLSNGFAAISDAGFAAAGAFLIFLPGILTTLAGLALFSPSVRHALMRWFIREKNKPGVDRDGILNLDASEWQELDKPKRRRGQSPSRRA